MIGTRADNSHVDSVSLVPACISIDNVDPIARVEVVNGPFSIDSPDLIFVSVRSGMSERLCT